MGVMPIFCFITKIYNCKLKWNVRYLRNELIQLLEPTIEHLGFELADLEVKPGRNGGLVRIFIDKESLDERGLSLSDLQELVWEDEDEDYAEKSSINLVSRAELSEIMNQQDVILSF